MLEQINEWNSFLFREGMKAERDDPRPKAPADIFNLFRECTIYRSMETVHSCSKTSPNIAGPK